MAREDYPGTYYAHEYASDERERGAGPPSAAPMWETLTGERYELKVRRGVYVIDTAKISGFDEATETPAKLFEEIPAPETEMERRQRLFPNTYYAFEFPKDDTTRKWIGPPSLGDSYRYENITGEKYRVIPIPGKSGFYMADGSQINNFDESAEMPAPLFASAGPQPETSKTNNIYYMTPDELVSLSASQSGTQNPSYPAEFLINILKMPFEISADNYTDVKRPVEYDGQTFESVMSCQIYGETIRVNFGSIEVPETYGNSRDYQNAQYILRLPYISDSQELEASDVVGKTVSVSVTFGVYTGDATATVYTDNIETPIAVMTGKVGRKVPFTNREASSDAATGFQDSFSEFLTPFIEVRTAEVVEGDFYNMVEKFGALTGVTGYIQATNSNMTLTGATQNERRDVEQMLADGVYIK